MRIHNRDVIKLQAFEVERACASKLDCRRLGPYPTVSRRQVVQWTCVCLGTDSIVSGVDLAPLDDRVIRVLDIDPIIVG